MINESMVKTRWSSCFWDELEHPWLEGSLHTDRASLVYPSDGGKEYFVSTYRGMWPLDDDWESRLSLMAITAENISRCLAMGKATPSVYLKPQGAAVAKNPPLAGALVKWAQPVNTIIVRIPWEVGIHEGWKDKSEPKTIWFGMRARLGVIPKTEM